MDAQLPSFRKALKKRQPDAKKYYRIILSIFLD
jgi:hypothetical protein